MAENVFEAVKQSVSTRDAAAFYGIEVKRNGMACCPFHDDKNPSMKLNEEYFYCFGCGATGDVIDFTAKLFDLSPKEAAEKLAQDFGLIYDSQAPPRRRYVRQKTEAQKFREDRQWCYRVLSDYYYLLKKWEADNSPRTPEEEPHPRFVEAIQKKTYVEYLLDLFLYESEANTEVRKKELFSKVRTGQVRVLMGSTAKMGAGTNVQDRLAALHDLDCPWRPGDLAQRKGRIERQGNQNPLVHVYRYVTEGTFDAYLWQTVENKQKFIFFAAPPSAFSFCRYPCLLPVCTG